MSYRIINPLWKPHPELVKIQRNPHIRSAGSGGVLNIEPRRYVPTGDETNWSKGHRASANRNDLGLRRISPSLTDRSPVTQQTRIPANLVRLAQFNQTDHP